MPILKTKYIYPKSATEVLNTTGIEWEVMPDTWQSGDVEMFLRWMQPKDSKDKIQQVWQLMQERRIKVIKK